jgi:hypothetical protein
MTTMTKINDAPVVTIALLVLATIVVVAGAVVTIVQPGTLSFHQYVQDVAVLAAALGLGAGIGRGAIAAADRHTTSPTELPPPTGQDQ